jgi:hypothetical protein
MHPPVSIVFATLWTCLATVLFSDAGFSTLSWYVVLVFLASWLVTWSFRFGRSWLGIRRDTSVKWNAKSSLLFWCCEPLVFVVIAAIAYSGALTQCRFWLSSFALERYVKDVRGGKINVDFEFAHPSRQVGLFSVSITDALPYGGVRFITSSSGVFEKAGFAHFPNGDPPFKSKNSYTHISGSWWKWVQHF